MALTSLIVFVGQAICHMRDKPYATCGTGHIAHDVGQAILHMWDKPYVTCGTNHMSHVGQVVWHMYAGQCLWQNNGTCGRIYIMAHARGLWHIRDKSYDICPTIIRYQWDQILKVFLWMLHCFDSKGRWSEDPMSRGFNNPKSPKTFQTSFWFYRSFIQSIKKLINYFK